MIALPQELINHIIDQLARKQDDDNDEVSSCKKALMACSLVSQPFLPQSKKHLFSYLHLSYPFKLHLPLYPTIAPYITHLALSISSNHEKEIQHSSNLLDAVAMLSPLQSFTMDGSFTDRYARRLDWRPVSTALEKCRPVLEPLLSSQLTTLNLYSIRNVPPALFSICVNLATLAFDEVSLQPSSSREAEADNLTRPRLLTFEILYFSRKDLLEPLFPSQAPPVLDLTGLRSLGVKSLDIEERDLVAVWDVMRIAKNTLRHLSWGHWSVTEWRIQLLPAAVDLSLFPALQTLEIPLIVDLSGAVFHRVCSVLATLSNSPITLELLTIVICEGNLDEEVLTPTLYCNLDWRKLLNVLFRTSQSRSGISELPIARRFLFDFLWPHFYGNPIRETLSSFSDWEEFVSGFVSKEFSKLTEKGNGFEFEYKTSEEEEACMTPRRI